MNKKTYLSLPFQNVTPRGWQNLAMAAVLTLNILQIGYAFLNGRVCQSYGVDYCAFYSAGKIINDHGFAEVYNLDLLTQYQKEIYLIDREC